MGGDFSRHITNAFPTFSKISHFLNSGMGSGRGSARLETPASTSGWTCKGCKYQNPLQVRRCQICDALNQDNIDCISCLHCSYPSVPKDAKLCPMCHVNVIQ